MHSIESYKLVKFYNSRNSILNNKPNDYHAYPHRQNYLIYIFKIKM